MRVLLLQMLQAAGSWPQAGKARSLLRSYNGCGVCEHKNTCRRASGEPATAGGIATNVHTFEKSSSNFSGTKRPSVSYTSAEHAPSVQCA